jgi:diguanylate cyclase (GGDEF)-like protein
MMPTAVRPRLMLVLAAAFGLMSLVLTAGMLVLPMLPGIRPVLPSPPQFAPWLFFCWHAIVAGGAFIYLLVRRLPDDGHSPRVRFRRVTWLAAAGIAGLTIPVAALLARTKPIVADGVYVGTANHTYAGPIIAVAIAIAALGVYRLRAPTPIERAFGLGLSCTAIAFGVFLLGGPHAGTAYLVGRVLVMLASLVVLEAAIRMLIASRARLIAAESTLATLAAESAKRAGRIHAIWNIVSLRESSERNRMNAILQIATDALRPGKPVVGFLAHGIGADAAIDLTAWSQVADEHRTAIARTIAPGVTVPLEPMRMYRSHGDEPPPAGHDPDAERTDVYARAGLRSFIGSPIEIAGRASFLVFASSDPLVDEPFAEDDLAYVETIAAFFAARFEQQQQFERIKFQIEHDALTGLKNRVQFRTAVRSAIAAGSPFAIAFIDLNRFRKVNERYGSQAGDYALLEIASRLRGVGDGDLIARVGSDEFGIMIAGALAPAALAAHLQRYAVIFRDPFPVVAGPAIQPEILTASIGAARFPNDGDTAESIIQRGWLALETAKAQGTSGAAVFEKEMDALLDVRVRDAAHQRRRGPRALESSGLVGARPRRVRGVRRE